MLFFIISTTTFRNVFSLFRLQRAGRGERAPAEEPGGTDGEQARGEREGGGQDRDQAQPHGVRPRKAQR
jgi:hypothetical protein